jgi:hypothetical protein
LSSFFLEDYLLKRDGNEATPKCLIIMPRLPYCFIFISSVELLDLLIYFSDSEPFPRNTKEHILSGLPPDKPSHPAMLHCTFSILALQSLAIPPFSAQVRGVTRLGMGSEKRQYRQKHR